MKFCTMCKFYRPDDRCIRDATTQNDLITGELTAVGVRNARRERDITGSDYCGPEAQFYEAKP